MLPVHVVLITGHPATGKTTLAHYVAQELQRPALCKDQNRRHDLRSLKTMKISHEATKAQRGSSFFFVGSPLGACLCVNLFTEQRGEE